MYKQLLGCEEQPGPELQQQLFTELYLVFYKALEPETSLKFVNHLKM